MTWKPWLHGLSAAVITAAASALALSRVDPQTFNFTPAGLLALAKGAGGAAILAAAAYLMKSPLPGDSPAPVSGTDNSSTTPGKP